MEKNYLVKWFFGVFFLCVLILGYHSEVSAAAYGPEDIGKCTADASVVGVNVYCEDQLMYYVHDVWRKNESKWIYDYSNLNGVCDEFTEYMYKPGPLWLQGPESGKERFVFYSPNLFKALGGNYEDYSIIIEHYLSNKLIRSYLETPFDDMDSYYQTLSLMYLCKNNVGSMLKVSSYNATSASYRYKLYKILRMKQDGDIKVASGSWSVTSPGDAYYDGSRYIIHSLPQLTSNMQGYNCTLEGWYSAATGGKKYQVGDAIEKGCTIYPHWTKTPIAYPVQCIDVLGKDSSGKKLGESQWMQNYSSVATGAKAGCIPTESMYYEGTIYTGCSQCTVGVSGNVVFRYFDYAEYPVQIIDCISLGPNTGKELLRTSRKGKYKTSVSGNILGSDPRVGAYYQGYYYYQSTSAVIGIGGVSVYRYFVPVQYDVVFQGNGSTSGTMGRMQACWYDQTYPLISNAYQKEICLSFALQSEDAVCDTQKKKVSLRWSGWAESSTGSVSYSDQESVRNLSFNGEDKHLYAVWSPADVTVTAVPKRMGYIFAGWSEDPKAVSGNMEFQLQKDTTLYAIWKPDIVNYHVEYYKENLDGSFQMTTQYKLSNYTDSLISLENSIPDYQGYYLDPGSSTLQGKVQGDGSLVLMAYYRRNSYQISFEEEIDEGALQILQGIYEQTVQIPDVIPKRDGYQFKGWTADPESTQVYCMPGDTYRIPNHNQTLYAIWQPNAYEIRFDDNVADQEKDFIQGEMDILTAYYGLEATIPECKWTRKGYQFTGWNTVADGSGTEYHEQQKICCSDLEQATPCFLYAMWEPLQGEIQYQINVPEQTTSTGKGKMENTEYQYDHQWSLSPCRFELTGYDFCGWNTQADGTGEAYQDEENMYRKMAAAGLQNLYAVWKPKTDTRFYLRLEKKTIDNSDTYYEMLELKGETDSLLSDAVIAYYQKQGMEVTLKDFITGFTVMNAEELKQNIVSANGHALVTLVLERKKHKVQILRDASDPNSSCYASEETLHEDLFQLPDCVNGVKVKRYVDSEGNYYYPKESISVHQDICLMMQHVVTYHDKDKLREEYVSHDMPLVLDRPEEKEYYFSAWYWDETYRDYAGKAEDVIYITEDCALFAKWSSEKINYQIQYEWNHDSNVFFLDDPIRQYQYGEQIVLPVASQLWIPMDYEFVGWYESGDENRTVITAIAKEAYGDKKYCLLLRKKRDSEEKPDSGNQTPDPSAPSLSTPSPSGPDENPKGDLDKGGDEIKDLGNVTPNPDTDFGHPVDGSADLLKQPETPITQLGSGSPTNTISGGSKVTLPVLLSKGNASQGSAMQFVRGCLTYQIIKTEKKAVSVIAVDAKATYIKIPSYVTWKGTRYSVTRIDQKAFYNCKKLKKVTIGKQVSQIRKKAFYGCKKLRTVIIRGKKIRNIQKKAFAKTNEKLRFSLPKRIQEKYICLLKKSKISRIQVRK